MSDAIEKIEVEKENEELFRTVALKTKNFVYTEENSGFEETIMFKLPTMRQKETANLMFSKVYGRLLQDPDYMTTKQLLENAKARDLWSDADEERFSEMDTEIIEAKEKVSETPSAKKKDKLNKELVSLRDEKFRLALRLSQITSNSIDNLAETSRTEYMIVNCIFSVDEDGNESPLYKNKEELSNETDLTKLERILLDARSFWSGEGLSDFLHLDD